MLEVTRKRLLTSLFLSLLAIVSEAAASVTHNAVIVLLDRSGSMRQTDPACLRSQAARLLLSLLPDGDRVLFAFFGDQTGPAPQTTSFVTLDTPTRVALGEAAAECRAADAHTDILAALDFARVRVKDENPEAFRPVILLLTDGKDDVGSGVIRTPQIIEMARRLRAAGTSIHVVGLSSNADADLLRQIADATDGEFLQVDRAEQLLGGFFGVSRALGNRWEVGAGFGPSGPISIEVPPWSDRALALIVGAPGLSSDPAGREIDGGQLYAVREIAGDKGFSISLGPLPPSGEVIVDAVAELALAVRVPAVVAAQVPFQCHAEIHPVAAGAALGKPRFLRRTMLLADWSAGRADHRDTLYDDGVHDDGTVGDGIFGGVCTAPAAGEQEVSFVARTPLAPTLSARALIVAEDSALSVSPPGFFQRWLIAPFARKIPVRVKNVTAVPLRARLTRLTLEGVHDSAEAVVPPDAAIRMWVPVPVELSNWTTLELSFELVGSPAAGLTYEVAIPPGAWPYGLIAILVILGMLSFALPRRTPAGSILAVQVDVAGHLHAEAVTLAGDGPITVPAIPPPFDSAGIFLATSGIWRRVIVFDPGNGVTVRFEGRAPAKTSRGFAIRRPCTWTRTEGDATARYRFTPRV